MSTQEPEPVIRHLTRSDGFRTCEGPWPADPRRPQNGTTCDGTYSRDFLRGRPARYITETHPPRALCGTCNRIFLTNHHNQPKKAKTLEDKIESSPTTHSRVPLGYRLHGLDSKIKALQWALADAPQIEYAISCGIDHPKCDINTPNLGYGTFTDLAQAQNQAKPLHGRVFQRTINSWEPATNPTKDA